MHGKFLADLEATLVGRALERVSLSKNTVSLSFTGGASLTFEFDVDLQFSFSFEKVVSAIERRVTGVEYSSDYVALLLDGGGVVRMPPTSDKYETFHVRLGERETHY